MKRKIVRIDETKCNGCGLCISACAEGALALVDGKARLISESYCDGLGACLPECPVDAIRIEEREADKFDEVAVERHMAAQCSGGCPGSAVRTMAPRRVAESKSGADRPSMLSQWPVQLKLVPPSAPFLAGADILVCADCVPFALAGFHEKYLSDRVVLVGCPKLDDIGYYGEKLRQIIAVAKPASVTVLRMEVPCCSGIARAAVTARDAVAPELPVRVETIGINGEVLDTEIV